jgi:hypothetical protein
MMQPICSVCEEGMFPRKVGVLVIELAHNPPRPHRLWRADEWECPRCSAKVVAGFSSKPSQPNAQGLRYVKNFPQEIRLWKESSDPVTLDAVAEQWELLLEREEAAAKERRKNRRKLF